MAKYNRTEREFVYKGNIISMYRDHITIDDTQNVIFDYIDHKGAAAMIPVNKDGNILMVSQYRNAINRDTLEIPAGGMNLGETMLECAMRECEEETGYRPKNAEHLIDIYTTVAFCNEKIGIFYTEELETTKQHLDDDEYINVKAYPIDELIQMIYDGKINDAKTISGLLAYKQLMINR